MKTRLFRTVVAFFFAGMALTWVGCSDYDQDIADLNSRIDELTTGKIASIESQYSSLQSTLNSLQSADAAMTSKIAALEASAKQDVADLKGEQAAIQQALADMEAAQKTLKETIAAVEAQLDGFLTKSDLDATLASYATTEALAEVAAALDGVEDAVVAKAIEEATKAAVEAAGKALEESFQAKFDAALASAGLVTEDALKAKIDEAAAAMDQKIADAIAKAMENNGEVSVDIAKELAAAVEQIAQYLHGRLTSLLIVPDLYEDGIETVEFKTLAYTEWTKSDKEAYTQKGNKTFTTSYLTQKVNYTVGPKVVATEDIEKPVFVFNEAECPWSRLTVPGQTVRGLTAMLACIETGMTMKGSCNMRADRMSLMPVFHLITARHGRIADRRGSFGIIQPILRKNAITSPSPIKRAFAVTPSLRQMKSVRAACLFPSFCRALMEKLRMYPRRSVTIAR